MWRQEAAIVSNLSKRERTLLIICVIVLIGTGLLLLFPAEKPGGMLKQLPLAEAQRKLRENSAEYERLGKAQTTLDPQIDHMVYDQAPDALVPQVTRDLL